ncbi:MAG: YheU family protein [Gammaproteobacteria bacterium]|nr:YheU family protein [Gammaproteobacteria bacterium]
MIIPHQELSPDALQALVEEFVTRSGTDYGTCETSLTEKVQQVVRQLENGEAVIVYDTTMEACNITTAALARADDQPETN